MGITLLRIVRFQNFKHHYYWENIYPELNVDHLHRIVSFWQHVSHIIIHPFLKISFVFFCLVCFDFHKCTLCHNKIINKPLSTIQYNKVQTPFDRICISVIFYEQVPFFFSTKFLRRFPILLVTCPMHSYFTILTSSPYGCSFTTRVYADPNQYRVVKINLTLFISHISHKWEYVLYFTVVSS